MKASSSVAVAALLLGVVVWPLAAQSPPIIQAVRAAAPPQIDGRIDPAEWQNAPVATGFTQARPSPGSAASHPTEVRVLYDDRAVYIAARMHDPAPDSIVAQLARRDQAGYSDLLTVALDSYHDRRTAFSFSVNPRGVRRDLMIHDDASEDPNWDAVWDAATAIDVAGWTAEIRIPLSQLRFDADAVDAGGGRVWGINFSRTLARHDELSHWAPIPPDAAGLVSRFGELQGLRDLRPARRLEVQPYSVARLTREPGSPEDPFHRSNDFFGSAGVDLRYGVTSDLTVTATINPDFGQVEADPSQLNLTAFESYFPERRPFFTEGSEIFSTGWPELVYSRRIGRAPQGRAPRNAVHAQVPEASTILGAAKLTGKTSGGWSIGVLGAATAAERARFITADGSEDEAPVEPLTSYAVARVSRDFREGRSGIGGIFTATRRRIEEGSGLGFLPSAAHAGGFDARHRFGGGNYQLSGSIRGSYLRGSDSAIARVQRAPGHYFHRPDAEHLDYRPDRTSLGGYSADVALRRIGGGPWRWGLNTSAFSPGYEINDLGFHSGSDEIRQRAVVGYQQHRAGRTLRSWTLNVGGFSRWTFGGERQDAAFDLYHEFRLLNQWGGSVWYMRHVGGHSPTMLRGGPAVVLPARQMGMSGFNSDPRRSVVMRGGVFWEVEDGTGSRQIAPHVSFALRASDRAELSLRPSVSRVVNTWQWVARAQQQGSPRYVVGRLQHTTAALTARLSYTFTPDLSLQFYAQPYVSAGAYSRFRLMDDPRARDFDARFRVRGPDRLMEERASDGTRRYRMDADGDGQPDISFTDPNFNLKQLRSNAVLRWEYRPGSTLFVVWTQGRTDRVGDGSFDLTRDFGRLFGIQNDYDVPASNVFLIKLSYWLGM